MTVDPGQLQYADPNDPYGTTTSTTDTYPYPYPGYPDSSTTYTDPNQLAADTAIQLQQNQLDSVNQQNQRTADTQRGLIWAGALAAGGIIGTRFLINKGKNKVAAIHADNVRVAVTNSAPPKAPVDLNKPKAPTTSPAGKIAKILRKTGENRK